MKIALDAMGTDRAPAPEVEGALMALRDAEGVDIVLVGDEETIRRELARHGDIPPTLHVRHAPDRVTADGSGGSTLPTISGSVNGKPFIFCETAMGTWGAGEANDGQEGVPHIGANQ